MNNKLFFMASLMTFCFAKVNFDVKVSAGAASISNTKANINKRILKKEWLWANNANGTNPVALHEKTLAEAVTDAVGNRFWSKDGGTTWEACGNNAAANNPERDAYIGYVTSRAKDYQMSEDGARYDYSYNNGGGVNVKDNKGAFAYGLDAGIHYEITPCLKIGTRAFFTATNLKQDLSYRIDPIDKNGNYASTIQSNEREVQMLLGYAQAVSGGAEAVFTDANTTYLNNLNVTDGAAKKALSAGADEKSAVAAGSSLNAVYALNINRQGYKALKGLTIGARDKYKLTLDAANYGPDKGVVITKAGKPLAVGGVDIVGNTLTEFKAHVQTLLTKDDVPVEVLRNRNYALSKDNKEFNIKNGGAHGNAPTLVGITDADFMTQAVNITGPRAVNAQDDVAAGLAAAGAANKPVYVNADGAAHAGVIADTDVLEIGKETYDRIIAAFEAMDKDFSTSYVDHTLRVKNIWGGMITASWQVTDCTTFTFGAGIGLPSVDKIDNLKEKIGFAGMGELSARFTENFSAGLRYQYNKINLQEKDADLKQVDTYSKVNSNFHMFSATLSYNF